MPDPRDDLIRRSEITRLLTEADDRIDDPEDRLRVIANGLAMLPADVCTAPVSLVDAALKFAEVYIDRDAPFDLWTARVRVAEEDYKQARAALAGRERGR